MKIPRHRVLIEWIVGLVALVILGAIFFGGYGGLNMLMSIFPQSQVQTVVPSGTIFMSLGTISTTTGSATGLHPTILRVSDGTGFYYPSDKLRTGPALTMQLNLSSDLNQAVFLGALYKPIDTSSVSVSDGLTLYRADLSAVSDYDSELQAIQNAVPVALPTDTDYFRAFPSVNSAKEILYSSLSANAYASTKAAIGALAANKWNIMLADANGVTHVITEGLHPKWIDATHFAFLRDDGIYVYDLTARSEQQVAASKSMITIVNGFDLSSDGTRMALSEPGAGILQIYQVLNWGGGIIPVSDQLRVAASDVVFSPHADFLAALTYVSGSDPGKKSIPSIRYYSLNQHAFVGVPVLFDPGIVSSLYISDWQQ